MIPVGSPYPTLPNRINFRVFLGQPINDPFKFCIDLFMTSTYELVNGHG